jgi:hypothetical protein
MNRTQKAMRRSAARARDAALLTEHNAPKVAAPAPVSLVERIVSGGGGEAYDFETREFIPAL